MLLCRRIGDTTAFGGERHVGTMRNDVVPVRNKSAVPPAAHPESDAVRACATLNKCA